MIVPVKARAYFLLTPLLLSVTLAKTLGQPRDGNFGNGDNRTVTLERSQTYISPDQSFEFSVPAGYELYTGKEKQGGSYIPVCHGSSIVCAMFPKAQYRGTNFEAASFEVTLPEAETANACMSAGRLTISGTPGAPSSLARDKHPSRVISGVRFFHAFDGEGGLGHSMESHQYRGFKNGRCYVLAIYVEKTSLANYDPGAIKEFTKHDADRVKKDLNPTAEVV
jgi:hypothetical protein